MQRRSLWFDHRTERPRRLSLTERGRVHDVLHDGRYGKGQAELDRRCRAEQRTLLQFIQLLCERRCRLLEVSVMCFVQHRPRALASLVARSQGRVRLRGRPRRRSMLCASIMRMLVLAVPEPLGGVPRSVQVSASRFSTTQRSANDAFRHRMPRPCGSVSPSPVSRFPVSASWRSPQPATCSLFSVVHSSYGRMTCCPASFCGAALGFVYGRTASSFCTTPKRTSTSLFTPSPGIAG